jgi:hypothetical protein
MKEFEYVNQIVPLKNSLALRAQANILTTNAPTSIDLRTIFGTGMIGRGHYLTIQADCPTLTGRIYIAFGSSQGTIDPMAVGTGPTICYPLLDGLKDRFQLTGGSERAGSLGGTGVATLTEYPWLHFCNPSYMASGMLRLNWSSLASTQNSSEFCP